MGPRRTSDGAYIYCAREECASCHGKRPLLVLDLDDTVIRATLLRTTNTKFRVMCSRRVFYIEVRPGFCEFLTKASKLFDILFFTDSKREFAEQVISQIAPDVELNRCFFGESCNRQSGYSVKDLSMLHVPLNQVVLVDDIIGSGLLQPMNCIGITPWAGESDDRVLLDELLPVLVDSFDCYDVAAAARRSVKAHSGGNLRTYTV